MKLPKIETFYKLNQSYEKNDSNNKIQSPIEENLNNNIINSSNKLFLSKCYSTKFIPKILSSLKLSHNTIKNNKENIFDNFEINKDDIDNNYKINSYRDLNLSEKYNKIQSISPQMKNNMKININLVNKKIKIIKSCDNLFVNKNFNTNDNIDKNRNKMNILIEKEISDNINKKNEKDEDKTILPFSSKILKNKNINSININGLKYKDFINNRYEINNELTKKKAIDYNLDKNKGYHEHYIFFNNSFLGKNSWKNNLLKNILPKNINYILKEEKLKKMAKFNHISNQEKEKKEKNEKNKFKKKYIFRNKYNNNRNSFFNSEINNFINNYKNNNKIILSKRDENIKKNHIIFTKIPKNIFNNNIHTSKKIIQNSNFNSNNINNNLIKNVSYDSMINVNSLFNIKNYN